MDGACVLQDVGSGDGVSGWKWKEHCIFPPTPPSPPTHFRHNMYHHLYLSQQGFTIVAGTNSTSRCCVQVVFCGKWNLVCKFPGKPSGPGVWWNQTKPAILPSYRGQSGRIGGLIQPFEKQWGILWSNFWLWNGDLSSDRKDWWNVPIVRPVTMISWKRLAVNVLEGKACWGQMVNVFTMKGAWRASY